VALTSFACRMLGTHLWGRSYLLHSPKLVMSHLAMVEVASGRRQRTVTDSN